MSRRSDLRRLRRENQKLETENHTLKGYYIDWEQHVERTRRINHDIRKHMDVLHTIIDRLDLSETAASSVRSLEQTYAALIPVNYIEHTVINALLVNKMSTCKKLGIILEIEVHSFADTSMKDSDLVVLFSNLLDNAIEECVRLDSPSPSTITLKCGKMADNFILVCTNPTSKREFSLAHAKTEKTDSRTHGLGLRILEEMLHDYQGTITIAIHDGLFESTVLLPTEMEVL